MKTTMISATRKHERVLRLPSAELPGLILGDHQDLPCAPIPLCMTREARDELLRTVGSRPAETGALALCRPDKFGIERIEFDERGSSRATGMVYAPDHVWGNERIQFHLNAEDTEVLVYVGHVHSHPPGCDRPSGKSGRGEGDIGYAEEIFEANEWAQWAVLPILTDVGSDWVVLNAYLVRRANPVELFAADVKICPVEEFPDMEFNAEWERRCADETKAESGIGRNGEVAPPAAAALVGECAIDQDLCELILGEPTVRVRACAEGTEVSAVVQGVRIVAICGAKFPEEPPRVVLDGWPETRVLEPIPWADKSAARVERRLMGLFQWIGSGFSKPF